MFLCELAQPPAFARLLNRLLDYGEAHVDDTIKIDYFAVSLPDFLAFEEDLDQRNHRFCLYLSGLGKWGLGRVEEASRDFDAVQANDPGHAGAHFANRLIRESSMTADKRSRTAACIIDATTPRE